MDLAAWHQFLRDSYDHPDSIVIQDDTVIHFSDPAFENQALATGTIACDLSHLGLLQLDGADTVTFLQGQVTNDVRLLNGSNAHYTGYCNPKGRLLALFLAFSQNGQINLQLPKALVTPIMKRLKMFVMRSKVDIQDVSDSTYKFGLRGPKATQILSAIFGKIPQQDFELVTSENNAILKLPGTARYEIFTQADNAQHLWNTLKKDATPVGANAWEWLEIQAGIPQVNAQTQEEFVPQMLNLDAFDAINYKKGCYTGQEIVARTHYLGKIKRRTQLAHLVSDQKPNLNEDVVDANGQAVGKIVRCAPALESGHDVLVECRLENMGQDMIFWNNVALSFKSLPYSLEEK